MPAAENRREWFLPASLVSHGRQPPEAHALPVRPHPCFPPRCFLFTKGSLMHTVLSKVHRFLVSEDGPTAVEYAVMLALILVACITIITTLGTSISSTFGTVNSSLGGS